MAPAVLTRSYDNGRTGANTEETSLTPTLVSGGLRKLFSLTVSDDKRLEAQPLIVPQVPIPGGNPRDVVYVCTMANNVWAFDANTGQGLWGPVSVGTPISGGQKVNGHPMDLYNINDHWGILSTPVIDLDSATMYLVSWSSPDGTIEHATHRLHALSIVDGSAKHPPLRIQAQVPVGTGHVDFKSANQKQRSALLLTPLRSAAPGGPAKVLYMACGAVFESAPDAHGWVLAFDVQNFRQLGAWCATPAKNGGGVWQAGQGPAADAQGNVYFMTGNGDWDGKTDFSESFVKLSPNAGGGAPGLSLADWWTPFLDQDRPNFQDQDLGSGGVVVPPGVGVVLGAGKDGVLYVLDQSALGKGVGTRDGFAHLKSPPIFFTYFPGFNFDPKQPPNFNVQGFTHHLHGSPVFWNSPDHGPMLFCWGENENLRAWSVDGAGTVKYLARGHEVASAGLRPPGGMPGGMLTLSANGTTPHTGIVWATAPLHGDANKHVVEGVLRAYDATAFGTNPDQSAFLKLLWDSKRLPGSFNHNKFCPPVVWGGKVYVPTYDGRVDVYGP